jgi:hypothetical protein
MSISINQTVDILYKKLNGVSKTDTYLVKGPSNEANASPQLSPGSTIWQQDNLIATVNTLPASNSSVVTVYRDTLSSTVKSTSLSESIANETWATGLTNWIPPQFGSGYQVQLYAAFANTASPQTTGISLPAAGSGNSDSWYFDYSAGIVNFADTNVPTAVTGNVVYVVGARYTGQLGISTFPNGLTLGNITINNNAITSNSTISFSGNITGNVSGNVTGTILTPNQPYITTVGTLGNLTVTSNITAGNVSAGTYFYANGTPFNYGNVQVASYLTTYTGNVNAGNVVAGTMYGNILTDIITPYHTAITVFNSATAIGLPTGSNIARPGSPAGGYIRYNSDFNTVEFYNGVSWVSVVAEVNGQNFYGDGTNATFTLNQTTTAIGILVSINGTVQFPGSAYTVTGNQITFSEVPLNTDRIDIRYLAVSVVRDNNFATDITVNGNITLTGILSVPQTTKASNATGTTGQICWDANYIYVCTATNTWKRTPLTGGY